MGERFQFYVRRRNKEGLVRITAIHDQWCFGGLALKYSANLINKLRNTDWKNFGDYDIDRYIQAILSVRWHTPTDEEGDKFYFHNVTIEDMDYTPDKADTNHGCVIIDITDLEDIKAGFFDTEGKFQTAREMVSKFDGHEESIAGVYGEDSVFDRLKEDDYKLLIMTMQELKKGSESD